MNGTSDRADMYRRQLGGAESALRRERQRTRDLESLVRDLRLQLGNACDANELDEFDARIRELGVRMTV